MNAKFYEVGGCVRDKLLGLQPKDIDYAVEAPNYAAMRDAIAVRCGGTGAIKLEKPEFGTIRAVHPKIGGVDFVLCRREGKYSDGRRPDSVEVGTLEDDLRRRDFTVNAMAIDDDGNIVDLFGGRGDLARRVLRCVGDTEARMAEDALRILRAIRFAITKQFSFCGAMRDFLSKKESAGLLAAVSVERVREELLRCFMHDTGATLAALREFPFIEKELFARNLRLVPTIVSEK